jgi:CTD small phosphatase-like protein 2
LLSSYGAFVYLATHQTKLLNCNDKANQESRVANEDDEIEDFDPYLFTKNFPYLVEVVSSSYPMLLPKETRICLPITLVLDYDEALVHSTLEQRDDVDFTFLVHFNLKEHIMYVRCKPHLQLFMDRSENMFEIIVFKVIQTPTQRPEELDSNSIDAPRAHDNINVNSTREE